MTIDIADPPGNPKAPDACKAVPRFFQTHVAAGKVQVDISDAEGF